MFATPVVLLADLTHWSLLIPNLVFRSMIQSLRCVSYCKTTWFVWVLLLSRYRFFRRPRLGGFWLDSWLGIAAITLDDRKLAWHCDFSLAGRRNILLMIAKSNAEAFSIIRQDILKVILLRHSCCRRPFPGNLLR